MANNGIIQNVELFLKTQILDYSGLRLPRNIKPSDCDMILDNDGDFLWCEIKTFKCNWWKLSAGQQRLIKGFIRKSPEEIKAVILWTQPPEKYTGSNNGVTCCHMPNDVIGFQEIRLEDSELEEKWIVSEWIKGKHFQKYLDRFYRV